MKKIELRKLQVVKVKFPFCNKPLSEDNLVYINHWSVNIILIKNYTIWSRDLVLLLLKKISLLYKLNAARTHEAKVVNFLSWLSLQAIFSATLAPWRRRLAVLSYTSKSQQQSVKATTKQVRVVCVGHCTCVGKYATIINIKKLTKKKYQTWQQKLR